MFGRIPTGYQLQTLIDPSIYTGNSDLCGAPLSKNCSVDNTQASNNGDGDEPDKNRDEDEMIWLYLNMGPVFAVGLSGFWSILIFRNYWRVAYFCFVDDMQDMLCRKFLRNT